MKVLVDVPEFEGYTFFRFAKPRKGDYIIRRPSGRLCKYEMSVGLHEEFIYRKNFTPDYTIPDVLLAATFNRIMEDPSSWDQRSFHSDCGTTHCFCGHSEILLGEIQNANHIDFIKKRYNLSAYVAATIIDAENTLSEVFHKVFGLIHGWIDRRTGEYLNELTNSHYQMTIEPDFRFDLEKIQERSK